MKIYLHDATTIHDIKYDKTFKPIHGDQGHTHCGTITVDCEYQAEMWIQEVQHDHPEVVRIVIPDLGRSWKRVDGVFVET